MQGPAGTGESCERGRVCLSVAAQNGWNRGLKKWLKRGGGMAGRACVLVRSRQMPTDCRTHFCSRLLIVFTHPSSLSPPRPPPSPPHFFRLPLSVVLLPCSSYVFPIYICFMYIFLLETGTIRTGGGAGSSSLKTGGGALAQMPVACAVCNRGSTEGFCWKSREQ